MPAARSLASVLVVALAALCAAVQAQDRIKMCGRDLIRLAVSSCGNSRLRRSVPDNWAVTELDQHHYALHWDHDDSVGEQQAAETGESDGEEDVPAAAPHWYPMSLRLRRAAGKISDICCEKGCSLKELIQFC